MDGPAENLQVLLEELNSAREACQTAQAKYDAAKNSIQTQGTAPERPLLAPVSTAPTFNTNEIGRDMKKLWTGVTDKKMWTGVSEVFTLKRDNEEPNKLQ